MLAPTAGDAEISRTILGEAGLACHICRHMTDLCREFDAGVGAILVTEEGLAASVSPCLAETLKGQPAWSDVPVLLLCGAGADSSIAAWAMESIGNVTVLERPVRVTTLVSALRTALKARRRQYQLRDQLESLRRSEESLRHANERLKLLWETAAILLATDEPDAMLKSLFEKIRPHLELDIYFNHMLDAQEEQMRLQSFSGLPEDMADEIAQVDFHRTLCGTVALGRRPIVASFVQQSHDPKATWLKNMGVRAYACGPLLAGDKLLGTLSFASRTRDEFDPHDIAFLETISHYVTIAYERMQFIRALREDDRRKDEFLATLAHELRNPLAPIRSCLDLMQMAGEDRELIEEVRTTMETQVSQMVHLVDDLMDVSRITRGKLVLRKSRMDMAAAVRSAVEAARGLIRECDHQLTVTIPDSPLWMEADPTRLTQVFSNLLNNAAKYTQEKGEIWLTVQREGSDAVVTVEDNGMGIPAHMLDRIFGMFTQVEGSPERGYGGLGIGLTLVKTLVEMHQGTIAVESDGPGMGSKFTVRLPLLIGSATCELHPEPVETVAACGKRRILIVDDNKDAAGMLAMVVKMMGHEIRTAYDGCEAVEVAEVYLPDLVLMDIGMPRLNGYDAARRIREQKWGQGMVLVALTGWGQEEDRRRTKEAGFDHHCVKPIEPAVLKKLLADPELDPV